MPEKKLEIRLAPEFLAQLDDPNVPEPVKQEVRALMALLRQAAETSTNEEEFHAALTRLGHTPKPTWRPQHGYYLTSSPYEKGGFLAVISDGTPQLGHDPVIVLAVEQVASKEEGEKWFERMMIETPWLDEEGNLKELSDSDEDADE